MGTDCGGAGCGDCSRCHDELWRYWEQQELERHMDWRATMEQEMILAYYRQEAEDRGL